MDYYTRNTPSNELGSLHLVPERFDSRTSLEPTTKHPNTPHHVAILPRVEFPRFKGENPRVWINEANKYFQKYLTFPEDRKVELAYYVYFDGDAKRWFQSHVETREIPCWDDFVNMVLDRFEFMKAEQEPEVRKMHAHEVFDEMTVKELRRVKEIESDIMVFDEMLVPEFNRLEEKESGIMVFDKMLVTKVHEPDEAENAPTVLDDVPTQEFKVWSVDKFDNNILSDELGDWKLSIAIRETEIVAPISIFNEVIFCENENSDSTTVESEEESFSNNVIHSHHNRAIATIFIIDPGGDKACNLNSRLFRSYYNCQRDLEYLFSWYLDVLRSKPSTRTFGIGIVEVHNEKFKWKYHEHEILGCVLKGLVGGHMRKNEECECGAFGSMDIDEAIRKLGMRELGKMESIEKNKEQSYNIKGGMYLSYECRWKIDVFVIDPGGHRVCNYGSWLFRPCFENKIEHLLDWSFSYLRGVKSISSAHTSGASWVYVVMLKHLIIHVLVLFQWELHWIYSTRMVHVTSLVGNQFHVKKVKIICLVLLISFKKSSRYNAGKLTFTKESFQSKVSELHFLQIKSPGAAEFMKRNYVIWLVLSTHTSNLRSWFELNGVSDFEVERCEDYMARYWATNDMELHIMFDNLIYMSLTVKTCNMIFEIVNVVGCGIWKFLTPKAMDQLEVRKVIVLADKLSLMANVGSDFMHNAMNDENNHVKYTTSWTLSRIFELLHSPSSEFSMITSTNIQHNLGVLLDSLKDTPIVAEKVGGAIYFLAQGYENSMAEFGEYMQDFYKYLEMGLQNFEEYQEKWLVELKSEINGVAANITTTKTNSSIASGVPFYPDKTCNRRIAFGSIIAAFGLFLSKRLDFGVCLKDLSTTTLSYVGRLQKFAIREQILSPHLDDPTPAKACAISGYDNFVVIGTAGGWIERFNLQSGVSCGKNVDILERKRCARNVEVVGVACDSTNTIVISGGYIGHIKVRNFKGRELKSIREIDCSLAKIVHLYYNGFLATVEDDLVTHLFDVIALRLVRIFEGHSDCLVDIWLSMEGNGFCHQVWMRLSEFGINGRASQNILEDKDFFNGGEMS